MVGPRKLTGRASAVRSKSFLRLAHAMSYQRFIMLAVVAKEVQS